MLVQVVSIGFKKKTVLRSFREVKVIQGRLFCNATQVMQSANWVVVRRIKHRNTLY